MLANHPAVSHAVFCVELLGIGQGARLHPRFFTGAEGDRIGVGPLRTLLRNGLDFESRPKNMRRAKVARLDA